MKGKGKKMKKIIVTVLAAVMLCQGTVLADQTVGVVQNSGAGVSSGGSGGGGSSAGSIIKSVQNTVIMGTDIKTKKVPEIKNLPNKKLYPLNTKTAHFCAVFH